MKLDLCQIAVDLYQKETIKSISKGMPKKVETTSHTYEISPFVDYVCPDCSEIITKQINLVNTCLVEKLVELKYCYNCGQRLEWKE